MRLIFPILFLLLLVAACTKNSNFTTKPQLKIKSVNSTEISGDETLEFIIHLTDKEGDFTNYFGISTTTPNCPASDFTDSSLFVIPNDFIDAKKNEGDIVLDLDKTIRHSNQCAGPGSSFLTDTTVYRFWTKDRAGNVSDTAISDPIIIHP
jgi:hypothetical protein